MTRGKIYKTAIFYRKGFPCCWTVPVKSGKVSITKRDYSKAVPSQRIKNDFPGTGNYFITVLTSFYWRDTPATKTVRLNKVITGICNMPENCSLIDNLFFFLGFKESRLLVWRKACSLVSRYSLTLYLPRSQDHRLHNRSVYPEGSSIGSPAISLA